MKLIIFLMSVISFFGPCVAQAGRSPINVSGSGAVVTGGATLTYEGFAASAETTNVSTHNAATTGLTIDSGDLIVLIGCPDRSGSDITQVCPDSGVGWNEVEYGVGGSASAEGVVCTKQNADGTEDGGTLDWTTSSTQQSVSVVMVFNGHNTDTGTSEITCSAGTSADGTNDATSTALAIGDATDIMIRAFCSDAGFITTDTGFPSECDTNITIHESVDGGSGPASGGVCLDASPTTSAVVWTSVFSPGADSTGFSCRVED